jgi:glycine betaine/choline ABC-type transport system substrate-binding protein
MRNAVLLLLLAAATGCFRGPDRAPVVLASKSSEAALAERVAKKLTAAGCRVTRRFDLQSSVDADRAMENGAIDAYLESQRTALTVVLGKKIPTEMSVENAIRPPYVNRGMLWSPPLGRGDLAVVFRKDVDQKCREATRAFMRVAYVAEDAR